MDFDNRTHLDRQKDNLLFRTPSVPSPHVATEANINQFEEFVSLVSDPKILRCIWLKAQPEYLTALFARENDFWKQDPHEQLLLYKDHVIALRDGEITPSSYFIQLGAPEASDSNNPYMFLVQICDPMLCTIRYDQKMAIKTITSIEEAQLLVDQVITDYNVTPDDVVQRVSRATQKEAEEVRDWVIPRIQIDYMALK